MEWLSLSDARLPTQFTDSVAQFGGGRPCSDEETIFEEECDTGTSTASIECKYGKGCPDPTSHEPSNSSSDRELLLAYARGEQDEVLKAFFAGHSTNKEENLSIVLHHLNNAMYEHAAEKGAADFSDMLEQMNQYWRTEPHVMSLIWISRIDVRKTDSAMVEPLMEKLLDIYVDFKASPALKEMLKVYKDKQYGIDGDSLAFKSNVIIPI